MRTIARRALHEDSSSIVSAAVLLYGLLGILAILLSGVLAYTAPMLFNIPESLVTDSRIVIVIGGVTLAASLMGGASEGWLQDWKDSTSIYLEMLVTTVRTTATVIALREGYGIVALAWIQFAASVSYGVTFWAAARKLYPEVRIRLKDSLVPQVRILATFSGPLFVLYCFGLLIGYSDAAVIAAFLPIEAVAFFAIAGNLSLQASGLSELS